jgi:gas vesicle protein
MKHRTPDLTSFVSFLAGGVTGAAVALLLARESGDAARQRIARKLRDAADSARDLAERVVDRGEEIGDEVARRVDAAGAALAGPRPPETRGHGDEVASA